MIFMLTVLWQCLWHVAVAVVVAVIACGMSCLSLKIVFIMPSALSIAALSDFLLQNRSAVCPPKHSVHGRFTAKEMQSP